MSNEERHRVVPRVRIPLEALEPLLVELRDVLREARDANDACCDAMAAALQHLEAVLVEVDG